MPKKKKQTSMKFYSMGVIRDDIRATRLLGPVTVALSPLRQKTAVAVPLSWIVQEALELAARGKTHMRFMVIIPHKKINYGAVVSPKDYGLFIESTKGVHVGFTEDIPPIKCP